MCDEEYFKKNGEHAVEPGEELLGAVVRVKDDGDTVGGGDGADVVSGSDGTGDGSLLLVVLDTLTGEEGGTTLGDLENDGGLRVAGTLKGGDDGRGRGNVLQFALKVSLLARISTRDRRKGSVRRPERNGLRGMVDVSENR
jgi:hypothetical protein